MDDLVYMSGVIGALLCSFITMYIFQNKNRPIGLGFAVGFLLGIFGIIVTLFVPALEKPAFYVSRSTSPTNKMSWNADTNYGSRLNANRRIRSTIETINAQADTYKTCLNCMEKNERDALSCRFCEQLLRNV